MRNDPELLKEIRGLRADLQAMTRRAEDAEARIRAEEELRSLREQVEQGKIERDRQVETHEREKREIQHMVGLERKRQEFEIEAAKREAVVTVREENLVAEKKRFEEQLTETTARFQATEEYLKGAFEQVLERLPTVTVDRTITETAPRRPPARR